MRPPKKISDFYSTPQKTCISKNIYPFFLMPIYKKNTMISDT